MTCNHINDSKVVWCDLDVTDVNLDENEDEEYIYIIHFYQHPKINENVVVFATWKMIHMPLNTMSHLFNFICDYES